METYSPRQQKTGRSIWSLLLLIILVWLLRSSSAVLAAPASKEVQPAALNALVPLQNVVQVAASGSYI